MVALLFIAFISFYCLFKSFGDSIELAKSAAISIDLLKQLAGM